MPKITLSKLTVFILASLAVHAAVAFWLRARSGDLGPVPRGVVDIDFIQSATHETTIREKVPTSAHARRKTTEPAPSATPKTPSQAELPGDPQAIARASDQFLQTVSRLVDANKIYPKESLRREEYGRVVVGVTINRDGTLGETRLEELCPFEALNQAALKTVQTVRVPPLPAEIPAPLHLHIPLVYRLERN